MKIVSKRKDLIHFLEPKWNGPGKIGFVPTMGALHKGHLSLILKAIQENSHILVSIFVNPTQFNDSKDLKNYPRRNSEDLDILKDLLREEDIVFIPEEAEMYPEPDTRSFNFGHLDKIMEGAHRPGHFNGVAQIVSKLFDLIKPDFAYFGEKDLQQLIIIKKLTEITGSNTTIIGCPIIRDNDGLAMSSRNQLLGENERKEAAKISQALFDAAKLKNRLNPIKLRENIINRINSSPELEVEYFEFVDGFDLKPVLSWDKSPLIYGCIAVKVGLIRLLDNFKLVDRKDQFSKPDSLIV